MKGKENRQSVSFRNCGKSNWPKLENPIYPCISTDTVSTWLNQHNIPFASLSPPPTSLPRIYRKGYVHSRLRTSIVAWQGVIHARFKKRMAASAMARSLDTLSGLRVWGVGQARGWIYPGGGQINLARITRPSLSYSLKYFTRTTTRIFLSGETLQPPSSPSSFLLDKGACSRGPPSQHRSRGLITLDVEEEEEEEDDREGN